MTSEIIVHRKCPCCKQEINMAVDQKALTEWRNNVVIQMAFPFLSKTDKEWLMTGLCAKCQDVMFGE